MMAISSRLRFEVLRRDGFKCRYCGALPVETELHVDHVVPQALGGDDQPANLVSSCQPCNSGKSSMPLDGPTVEDISAASIAMAEAVRQASREAEIEAQERSHYNDQLVDFFEDEWESRRTTWAEMADDWRPSVIEFHRRGLSTLALVEAIDIAMSKRDVPQRQRWNYFCGICWNMLRNIESRAQEIMRGGSSALVQN